MLDENITFFEKQKRIYPRAVDGRYRRLKWAAIALLLTLYYAAPWLRWDRGAGVPGQAILIDMPARRAYFFALEIWPDEIYFLVGVLVLAAVGLFCVTSILGRVWCGYACPQTVWTDLFVWVEEKIQGDRNARMRLDAGGWTFKRLWKKAVTHILWIFIGLVTGGAWVFYFNDAPQIVDHIRHLDLPWSVGSWIIALTGSTYLMAGFAREQVCKYMCPYARFQSAMFDKDTLIIGYDRDRGEPRGKHKKGTSWEGKGHCVDCTQCVVVCPAGIDIRNGLQMECIACGLCVDACNDVMEKLELPKGLIRYDTQRNIDARRQSPDPATYKDRLRLLRPRTFYYMGIMSLVAALMVYAIFARPHVELHAIQNRNPLFVKLSDGSIRNSYVIKILNKTQKDKHFSLTVDGISPVKLAFQAALPVDASDLEVAADDVEQFRVTLVVPPQAADRIPVNFHIREAETGLSVSAETIFVSGDR